MLKTVPKYFFKEPNRFKYLAGNSQNCILYKTLSMDSIQGDYFVSQHVITLVLKGEKHIQLADGKRQTIRAGQFAYIPKDLYLIQDIIPENDYFESWLFFFDESLCERFLTEIKPTGQNGTHIATTKQQQVAIFDYSRNLQTFIGGLSPLLANIQTLPIKLIELKINELLHLLALEKEGHNLVNQLRQLIAKPKRSIVAFMESHYTKPLKVEDYAYLTGRSLSSFLRDFKKQYQTTPKKWLREKRLAQAKELLLEEEYSVTEVALEIGYENISHFIRGFKEKYQLSPKQFKIKYRSQVF